MEREATASLMVCMLGLGCSLGALILTSERASASPWTIQTVDSNGDVGQYSSIALDSKGYPHISYWDRDFKDLKYARWNGSAWNIMWVDGLGDLGTYTSIAGGRRE